MPTYKCRFCKDTGRVGLFFPGSFANCEECPTGRALAGQAEVCEDDSEEDDPGSVLTIAGEVVEISRVFDLGNGGQELTSLGGGRSWIVFEDAETAGQAARDYWAEMVQDDPEQFREMVGTESLTRWALGQSAGPGNAQVCSLEAWLDLYLDIPEEHFAGYDGEECEVDAVSADAEEEIGFAPGVAYRSN